MKKIFKNFLPLSLLVFLVSCANPYKEGLEEGKRIGYQEGYDVGYGEGHAKGDEDGYARAKAYFETAGYNEGYSDGNKIGLSEGYASGYTVGKKETYQGAYNRGYKVGYDDGDEDGYNRGYDDGYDDGHDDGAEEAYNEGYSAGHVVGYSRGYDAGELAGYDTGYDAGFDAGYDVGYDDGYKDGSLSVGKSKKLKGFANIISLAHNEVFDYSQIPAPKSSSQGLLVNGRVLLSDISLTNKDTLKRKAVVEQYLVFEMAKQVRGKFGLSADRSLKIAKAANHFRKQSSRRALTTEDTNAYAAEIIGSDFSEVSSAYEKTLKGEIGAFQEVLEKAAEKNGTTPENISLILAKYFI